MRVRVHQHVNPLSPFYTQEPEPIDVDSFFADKDKPLLIDIGCARGRFLLKMAEANSEFNYLGIEIRNPLVTEANRLADEAGLDNLHYIFCNAMLWFNKLFEKIPVGKIHTAAIQFPDPWFKKRHSKRRMVNTEMVQTLADKLDKDGIVFVQTDIEFLAEEMFTLFRANPAFNELPTSENPFPIKTEREIAVETKELPVYRSTFLKK